MVDWIIHPGGEPSVGSRSWIPPATPPATDVCSPPTEPSPQIFTTLISKKKEPMSYTDKQITCVDCGTEFTFSSGEQERFAQLGFTNEPKRCSPCRAAKKASQGSEGSGARSSGNRGGRSGGPREMFPAVCAQCGKPTQVPFQPRGDRPVYCSDCFSSRR